MLCCLSSCSDVQCLFTTQVPKPDNSGLALVGFLSDCITVIDGCCLFYAYTDSSAPASLLSGVWTCQHKIKPYLEMISPNSDPACPPRLLNSSVLPQMACGGHSGSELFLCVCVCNFFCPVPPPQINC